MGYCSVMGTADMLQEPLSVFESEKTFLLNCLHYYATFLNYRTSFAQFSQCFLPLR